MSKLQKAQTQQGHSRHFFEYIRAIGESKSKQTEDKLVCDDLIDLRKTLADKHIDKKRLKEYVVRAFYAEMLGQPAEFSYIHCVNLTSSTDLLTKKTGYLASWLCVSPEHELMYLLVANLQRDMSSSNFLEVSTALTACAKLIRPELMATINNNVVGLMSHPNSLVRKKVVLCMHAFYRRSEGMVGDIKRFREALCDKDPSVMGASLQLLYDVCLNNPVQQLDLLPSFVSIQKQILEHRLPRDFDYHRVPAPWLQLKLLRLIALLIGNEKSLAERFKDVILDTMKRGDTGLNIGHAIVFECINTITSIAPVPELIEAAADAIAKFLTSSQANLKYLGVTALSRIVRIDRRYAQEHQQVVMNCLEDSDDTIRRKTITLLFAMCNESNVEAIVSRLIKFLSRSTDDYLRREMVRNICDVSEKYNTNTQWYVDTLNTVLDMAAEHVPQETIQGMLKLIAEGEGEDEALDAELRTYCVETYFLRMEGDKSCSNLLTQVAAWVMGEYGFLTKKVSRAMLMDRLCDMLERSTDSVTKGWILSALMKIVAANGIMPENVLDVVSRLKDSKDVALQQRCYEFLALAKVAPLMKRVLPLDGCCEEIEVDKNLPFLDVIVQDALSKGARPYERRELRLGAREEEALRTEAYKNQDARIVDEDELDANKFNEEEDIKLIVKEGARRWGVQTTSEPEAPSKEEQTHDAPAEPTGKHTDPVTMEVAKHKPSKNEKFFNNIFAEGGAKKKKPKRGDRQQEALRRAQEAETATRGMTTENSKNIVIDPALHHRSRHSGREASAGNTPGNVSSSPAPAPTCGVTKVQTKVEKQAAPDGLRCRFGILPEAEVRNVHVQLYPPAKCTIEGVKCNAPRYDNVGLSVTIPAIPGNVAAYIEFLLKVQDYPQGGVVGAELVYHTPQGVAPAVRASTPLLLPDTLRPVGPSANKDIFGRLWPTLAEGEAKVLVSFPQAITPDLLQAHLREHAQIRIIQIIGKEAIAGAMLAGPGQQPLLAHILVNANNNPNDVVITIRSGAKTFSNVVAGQLAVKKGNDCF